MNKTLFRILKMLAKDKILFFIALVATIIQVASTLLLPIIVGKCVDYIVGANDVNFSEINKYLLVLLLVIILGTVAGYFMQFLMNVITNNLLKKLRNETFLKLEQMPLSFIDTNSEGDIISRLIGDIDILGDGLLQALTLLISGVFTIVFTIVFMFIMSYQVALIVVCLTPLSLITAYLIAKYSYKTFRNEAKIKGEFSSHINEMLNMDKEILSYGYEKEAISKLVKINSDLKIVGFRAQFMGSLVNPLTRFINALVYATVGIVGAFMVGASFTVGNLTVFLSYASTYTKPFNDISSVISNLQASLAGAKRVFYIIDYELPMLDDSLELKAVKGSVSFNNVNFSYTNKPLIENFNLEVKPGQLVAIVGPTGAGKTTLINLLMRFYEVTSGTIFVDDKDISKVSKESLRSNMGMVLQDTWLFKGTILDNIRYGTNASLEEVKEVARICQIDTYIERLKDGYDTILDENLALSEGQKQLFAIARVMLKDPKILILDEATSKIDTRMEILVQNAFLKLMENKTTFIIAHRLETIKQADIILVLNKGNIIEIGNHESLLAKKGFYYDLYNSQYKRVS